MNNSKYKRLRRLDAKRLDIRSKYKSAMHEANTAPQSGIKIIFPKMHLRRTDSLLRNGLSWHYNGFLILSGATTIAVDPGVDFLYRLQLSNIDPSTITHIYVSHAHIDHYAGANSLMDWLIRAQKPVTILAPESVFTNKVVSDFHSARMPFPAGWKPLHSSISIKPGQPVDIDSIKLTPVEMYHGIECLGFRLEVGGRIITYLSDTGYGISLEDAGHVIDITKKQIPSNDYPRYIKWHKDLDVAVQDSDVLIANIDSFYPTKNSSTHLSILDLCHMISGANPKVGKVILAHINPVAELLYEEWGKELAEYVEATTKAPCVAPSSAGLTLEIGD